METPEYTLDLAAWPDPDLNPDNEELIEQTKVEAIKAITDISAWFVHIQDRQPRMRKVRINAVRFLRECGMTKAEIAEATGMSEHRINEVLKVRLVRATTP